MGAGGGSSEIRLFKVPSVRGTVVIKGIGTTKLNLLESNWLNWSTAILCRMGRTARNHPPTTNTTSTASVISTFRGHGLFFLRRRGALSGRAPVLGGLPGFTAPCDGYCGGI